MRNKVSFAVVLFMFVVLSFGFYWEFTDPNQLTRFLKEDGFLEWMGFLFLLSTSFFMFYVTLSQLANGDLQFKSRKCLVMLGLAFVMFLGAGEEISWAQRLTGHASSEFFQAHNAQAETNFHNLTVKGVKINKLIFGKLLFLFALFHNVILPLWGRKNEKVIEWVQKWGGFLPPLPQVGGFLAVAILVDVLEHDRRKEILEFSGSLHYYASIYMCYGMGFLNDKAFFKNSEKDAGRFFIAHLLLIILLAYILSTGVRTMVLPS